MQQRSTGDEDEQQRTNRIAESTDGTTKGPNITTASSNGTAKVSA